MRPAFRLGDLGGDYPIASGASEVDLDRFLADRLESYRRGGRSEASLNRSTLWIGSNPREIGLGGFAEWLLSPPGGPSGDTPTLFADVGLTNASGLFFGGV